MDPSQALKWYEHQKNYDRTARDASEKEIESELSVFANAMSITAHALDLARAAGPTTDLALKRKVGLAANAFNLLWSAWDAALAGRYSAASNSWRSIDETNDLMWAIDLDPTFADRMTSTKKDVPKARRIIRDAMVQSLGGGREWLQARQAAAGMLQEFSHVTFRSVGMSLGLANREGEKIGILRPGGVPTRFSLKLHVSCLASDALRLMLAVTSSFDQVSWVQEVYESDAKALVSWAHEALDVELGSVSPLPTGEVGLIVLIASTDEAPEEIGREVGLS